ncbi:hypothetical protein KFK09_004781 [Dendrobium nobile]|uniref:Alliinase C-terminal domain-containing protein n=1 Tax=Dendrobium nobile TaxID=94219 RepID=A0A8T3BWC6_DENNO|nr:hypothetical protein KFK09_004781 [Dendrobium nobile]
MCKPIKLGGHELHSYVSKVGSLRVKLSWKFINETLFVEQDSGSEGFPAATDVLQSALYKWAGDANSFDPHTTDPFIEVICSPNNPDGRLNTSVFKQITNNIHDLAYYWPQYTPITNAADYNIMLFSVSKSTGHAGSRLGWALVKDKEVARRMVQFVELGTIGVSKDSQLRAATVLRAVADGYEEGGDYKLFHFGRKVMTERWDRLRQVITANGAFSLSEYPTPAYCGFMGEETSHLPAFAWLKYEGNLDIEDTANFLRTEHNMLTRSGKHFGTDGKYVRISLLEHFDAAMLEDKEHDDAKQTIYTPRH